MALDDIPRSEQTAGTLRNVLTNRVTIGGTERDIQVVENRLHLVALTATPTISTAVYATGECVGGLITLANAAILSGGGIRIEKVKLQDDDMKNQDTDVVFFSATVAGTATDQSAFDPADADLDNLIDVVSIAAADYKSFTDNAVAVKRDLNIVDVLAGTSLFAVLVTRAAADYDTTTALTLEVTVSQVY